MANKAYNHKVNIIASLKNKINAVRAHFAALRAERLAIEEALTNTDLISSMQHAYQRHMRSTGASVPSEQVWQSWLAQR